MNKKIKTLDLTYTAIGAVLIAICSWISIPTTVPFTMQTFAVFFILALLDGKRATASIIIYVLLGAVGIPVFSGFSSGLGILLGTTGGYIIGFIFMGLIYMIFMHFLPKKQWAKATALIAGLIVCYAFGTCWFMIVYAKNVGPVGLLGALTWCVIPFIIPDIIKLALALTLADRLKGVLRSE